MNWLFQKAFSFEVPTPDPEFDAPWRTVTWSEGNRRQMLNTVKNFRPGTTEVSELKILLHGPIGAGKSTFVNSINTVLQGRNIAIALADSSAGPSQSFTLKLKNHRLKKNEPGSFYPFVFSDMMGLEPEDSKGVQTEDMIKILQGHIKDGYTFNPLNPIAETDPNYISNPGLKDRVHCLVSVLPADRISLIPDEAIQKMRDVRKKASDLGIPQVVILPMVDKACPLVNKTLRKIYESKKIKEKMEVCSQRLGVPMNCIFPLLNYSEQITNDIHTDILILMAATNIVNFANDYVEDQVYNVNQHSE
ncbi:interferon-induced protein 44-like isoform 2-T7 [Clarias gariepinus]|uniref:interferon-induced protein 44-like isoform X2 n=1 Tax=Clarias gariepinus TaxID=13013 RepID=UPI00234D3D9B|nr:interferon-induced protein 44-like isoform X2 [Clarias gariepinus]